MMTRNLLYPRPDRGATLHPPCSTNGGRRFLFGRPCCPAPPSTPRCAGSSLSCKPRLGPEASLIAQEVAHA